MAVTEAGLLNALQSQDNSERVRAATSIKHSIVGNPNRKRLFLSSGILRQLNSILLDPYSPTQLTSACVAILGSLTTVSSQVATEICKSGCLKPLLEMLISREEVRREVIRTLGALKAHSAVDFSNEVPLPALQKIMEMLQQEEFVLIALDFLTSCCNYEEATRMALNSGVLGTLVELLNKNSVFRVRVAVLHTITCICSKSKEASQQLTEAGVIDIAKHFVRFGECAVRMAAVSLLTTFYGQNIVDRDVVDGLIVVVVDVLQDYEGTELDKEASWIVMSLLEKDKCFHREAVDCCLINELIVMLERCEGATRIQVLNTMSLLASDMVEARSSLRRIYIFKFLLEAMSAPDDETVIAALLCTRLVTRHANSAQEKCKSHPMMDHLIQEILNQSIDLSASGSLQVESAALRAVCNLILVTPRKYTFSWDKLLWPTLVDCTTKSDEEIRFYSAWAMKNVCYRVRSDQVGTIDEVLEFGNIVRLCEDASDRVRIQGFSILRNMSCAMTDVLQKISVGALLNDVGDQLFRALEDTLAGSVERSSECALQALHVICNLAASSEKHKSTLLRPELLNYIVHYLSHGDSSLRVVAVRIIINLTWPANGRLKYYGRVNGTSGRRGIHSRLFGLRPRLLESVASAGGHGRDRKAGISGLSRSNAVSEKVNISSSQGAVRKGREYTNGFSMETSQRVRIQRLSDLGFRERLNVLREDPHVEVRLRTKEALDLLNERDVSQSWKWWDARIWTESAI